MYRGFVSSHYFIGIWRYSKTQGFISDRTISSFNVRLRLDFYDSIYFGLVHLLFGFKTFDLQTKIKYNPRHHTSHNRPIP
jgi:hypothetical protein